MKINILWNNYSSVDTKEKITIPDCFVVRQNKIWLWNWEAKLYVWNEWWELRSFFWWAGFWIKCFLLKSDLLKYMEDTKAEYLHPEQPYVNKNLLPNLRQARVNEINSLPDLIEFESEEQTQIAWPRIYIKSQDKAYKIIRELALPNITYISVVKLLDDNHQFRYYFRLFADYFWETEHPSEIQKQDDEINLLWDEEKIQISKARIWQWEYRKKLYDLCPFCPITLISDERLLIASHIKPWAKCNNFEKTDPLNWFMLSPMFDRLFDRWFITFTDDKKIKLSPFLSNMTYSKIWISDNKTFSLLPVEWRESYLKYHRENIFLI